METVLLPSKFQGNQFSKLQQFLGEHFWKNSRNWNSLPLLDGFKRESDKSMTTGPGRLVLSPVSEAVCLSVPAAEYPKFGRGMFWSSRPACRLPMASGWSLWQQDVGLEGPMAWSSMTLPMFFKCPREGVRPPQKTPLPEPLGSCCQSHWDRWTNGLH